MFLVNVTNVALYFAFRSLSGILYREQFSHEGPADPNNLDAVQHIVQHIGHHACARRSPRSKFSGSTWPVKRPMP